MFAAMDNIFDTQKRDKALHDLASCYKQYFAGDDMFVTNCNMYFMEDKEFKANMDELATGGPYPGMAWRMHILIWAIERTLCLEGDLCEFGTFRGFKMFFILKYFGERLSNKHLFLFDTFEGIDEQQSDGSPILPQEHQKTALYEFVQHRFKHFDRVSITKGSAPSSLDKVRLKKISFIHLDMNSYQAEIATLERIWDCLVPGASIVLDDFGLASHKVQMQKELPWFKERGYMPLELPTGQAIVIK